MNIGIVGLGLIGGSIYKAALRAGHEAKGFRRGDVVNVSDSDVVFEKQNQSMSNHGRGRLMVRELCTGIERNRYGKMNETIYHIPLNMEVDGGG